MPSNSNTATVSRSDSPIEWRRSPNTLTGVGVRSFSQTSSQSMSKLSLSRSVSVMITTYYDLLASKSMNSTESPNSMQIILISLPRSSAPVPLTHDQTTRQLLRASRSGDTDQWPTPANSGRHSRYVTGSEAGKRRTCGRSLLVPLTAYEQPKGDTRNTIDPTETPSQGDRDRSRSGRPVGVSKNSLNTPGFYQVSVMSSDATSDAQ